MSYTTSTGSGVPLVERVKEAIPGTEEYRATHGVTGAHAGAQGMKAHVPGTEEHRMAEAGVIGGGHHGGAGAGILGGTGATGTGTGATMGERVMGAIPGTHEYEATHGMTGTHRGVEQAKAMIPGTEEHHMRTSTQPGHGAGLAGMGAGAGMLGGEGHHHTGGMGAGVPAGAGMLGGEGLHTAGTGMGAGVPAGAGVLGGEGHHHTAGTGMGAGTTGGASEPIGTKIKKHIPGTREHEEKKLAEGRF